MEDYDYLKIAVAVYDADDTAQWLTFGIRLGAIRRRSIGAPA